MGGVDFLSFCIIKRGRNGWTYFQLNPTRGLPDLVHGLADPIQRNRRPEPIATSI